MQTRLGLDYRGTLNVSASGRPCISWADSFKVSRCGTGDSAIYPDERCWIAEEMYKDANNYCRAVPQLQSTSAAKLYCFVNVYLLTECTVPSYCGKEFLLLDTSKKRTYSDTKQEENISSLMQDEKRLTVHTAICTLMRERICTAYQKSGGVMDFWFY